METISDTFRDSLFWGFEPLPWQRKFLDSRAKSPWAIGANRSGKTEVGAYKAACMLKGLCPATGETWETPMKGWAIGVDFPSVDNVIVPKLMKYLDDELKSYRPSKRQIELKNGSQLWLKSCDSSRTKFQGADLDFAWFDEEPPFDVFKETWTRCIDRGGQVFGTMTPLLGSAWLYQRVYSSTDEKFAVFTMGMKDNVHLPEEEVQSAADLYRDEDEVAVRVRGEFRLFLGRPVLHVTSVQEILSRHVCAPVFRGRILKLTA